MRVDRRRRLSDAAGVAPAELRVYRLEDGGWTWCYIEPATDVELQSNTTYAGQEQAAAAARQAYPDTPISGEEGAAG